MANAVETPSQNNLMTEGSIVKSLLLFALPLIFGNLLQQMYNTADSIIVGNFVGANALVERIAEHAAHYKQVGGIGVLALGSDFDGIDGHHQLETAADMPLLADALRRAGFTEDEVERIFWRNARDFFEHNL